MLVAFKQMLRVAPTNQKLREEPFKYFLQSGHPETALEVADAGLKLDPYNADLYDLKSNACLFLSNFKCAVDALETMYTIDSTKADTLFFTKISAAAAEGEKPDTVRLLKWSESGRKKYPNNMTLLGYLNRGLCPDRSGRQSIAVTHRMMAKDTTEVTPALAAVQALVASHRLNEAGRSSITSSSTGIRSGRSSSAGHPGDFSASLLQGDSTKGRRRTCRGRGPKSKERSRSPIPRARWGRRRTTSSGLATFLQAPELDAQTEKNKSCDMATQEQQLLADADAALTAGAGGQARRRRPKPGIHQEIQSSGLGDVESVL